MGDNWHQRFGVPESQLAEEGRLESGWVDGVFLHVPTHDSATHHQVHNIKGKVCARQGSRNGHGGASGARILGRGWWDVAPRHLVQGGGYVD